MSDNVPSLPMHGVMFVDSVATRSRVQESGAVLVVAVVVVVVVGHQD